MFIFKKPIFLLYLFSQVFVCRANSSNSSNSSFLKLFYTIPLHAIEYDFEPRTQLFDSANRAYPRKLFHVGDTHYNTNISFLTRFPIWWKTQNNLQSSPTFHLHADYTDGNQKRVHKYVEFRFYITTQDTFLITQYRLISADGQVQRKLFAFKSAQGKLAKETSFPRVLKTDFALTKKDSAIIAVSPQTKLNIMFDTLGLQFCIRDYSLNLGPYEPPIQKPIKTVSDYQIRRQCIRLNVLNTGFKLED